jgi:hypothetical protein
MAPVTSCKGSGTTRDLLVNRKESTLLIALRSTLWGRGLVLDFRGPEPFRAGQESNQIARAVNQHREVLRAYPKRRPAILEREERHFIRSSAARDALLLWKLFRHVGVSIFAVKPTE